MRDLFITNNNFVEYMREAINIYVASAYLNTAIIDHLKVNLNKMPFKGGKNFRFLLDKDFHEEPEMRKVLINMILEIPHTQVKIYKGPELFHPKLYIFEAGNNVSTAIGSFNATAGGAGKNIEAGAKIEDRKFCEDSKRFFDKYWDSPYSEEAVYDPTAFFVARKFQAGEAVIIISSGCDGVVSSMKPQLINNEWEYFVCLGSKLQKIKESDLSRRDIAILSTEQSYSGANASSSIKSWLINYILEKGLSLSDKTLTSYAASRTEIYHYQFRPLMKILNSSDHRLLIADEVGLGKTIEAGIILKEFQSRFDMQRVLVVVPNSLKTKWRDELRMRFDEYFGVISAGHIVTFMKDYADAPDSAFIKGIITYDQLTNKVIREKIDKVSEMPLFDMVIMDEAHHLKNEQTIRYKVLKKLTRNARALILLTATPVQLHTKDLYNLLSILLPRYSEDALGFGTKLTLNEKIMEAIRLIREKNVPAFCAAVKQIRTRKAYQGQLQQITGSYDLLDRCIELEKLPAPPEIQEISEKLYALNILNRYISRTLRRDVAERFPDRVVETQEYEYSEGERKLYDAILESCRKRYSSSKNFFTLVFLERQAASSLIAMARSIDQRAMSENIKEYQDSADEPSDEGEQTDSDIDLNVCSTVIGEVNSQSHLKIDSKLEKLKAIIANIFETAASEQGKKVLIFATYIATIDYLKKELASVYPDVFIETLCGRDEIEQRDFKKKCFEEKSPSILICSEVAGEGLDFQFCRNLVNYDMPWNPSKLEQRVGRIDRIGQLAEKIVVVNLVNRYTIEDYIMAKLFERVKLFNSTIGPLGEVLGQYQKEFSKNLFQPERTSEEKARYEEKVLKNIENKKVEQKIFDDKQVELFGALDFIYDKSREKSNYFQEKEIQCMWDYFLKERKADSKVVLEIKAVDDVFHMRINDSTKGLLLSLVKVSLMGGFNKSKRSHYVTLINNLYETKGFISYTFSHKKAIKQLSPEFLTISHPFIQGALQGLKGNYYANKGFVYGKIHTPRLPDGIYIVFIYRFEVLGQNDPNMQFLEEKIFVHDAQVKSGSWDAGEIMGEIIDGDASAEVYDAARGEIDAIKDYLEKEAKDAGRVILNERKEIYNSDIDKKKAALVGFYNAKIDSIKICRQHLHDHYQREKMLNEIQDLEKERDAKAAAFKEAQLSVNIRCVGVAILNNERNKT